VAGELKPPRVRPAIRRIAIWVTPVLLLIAAWQIWDAIEARRLDQALTYVGRPPAATQIKFGLDDGAAKYYASAALFAVSVGGGGERLQATPGGPIVDAATLIRDALAHGRAPSKEAVAAASAQIERGRAALELVARASTLEFKGFSPGTDFNYRFSGLLNVIRLTGLETLTLTMNGEGDAAATWLINQLMSLRAFDEANSLMLLLRERGMQDVATDVGILAAQTQLSDARLADLDRALSHAYPDALEVTIRGEALWAYQAIRSMWEGRRSEGVQAVAVLLRPALRHHLVLRLATASDALTAARLPWPDRIRAMNEIPERHSFVPEVVRFIAASRQVPLVRDYTARVAEATAAVRCARLVIAIERYRRAHHRVPDSLNDVITAGDEWSIDPFNGKPLIYTETDSGYVVYSVGRNGRDEGGEFSPDLSRGRLRSTMPAPDVGVRVIRQR
jgi:hypothetical protein